MTIVGKILVFLNLVFSLVVGGLVLMVYLTRTNWEEVAKREKEQVKVIDVERKQDQDKFNAIDVQNKAANKILQDKITTLEEANRTLTADRDQKAQELAKLKDPERQKLALDRALQEATASRAEQVDELTKSNSQLQKDKVSLIEERNDERRARIQSDVEAKLYKSRNLELVSAIQDLHRELTKAKLGPNPTGAFNARKSGDDNPPPENVEGRIRKVDPETNLVTLSIGSDAGLAQGHVLEGYPTRPEAKYLGKLQVVDARPHEAVARPVAGQRGVTIQKGDTVASSILPPR